MLSAKELKILGSLKQKKYREKEGKFLIEGFHLIEECLSSSFYIEKIIVLSKFDTVKINSLKNKFKKAFPDLFEVSAVQFKKLSETENSQGIIGVVKIPGTKSEKDIPEGNLILALDRINNPGNLGTIIRTAYWFGVNRILVGQGSADVYNSKVIRATQGSIFHTNILTDVNLREALQTYEKSDFNIFLFKLNAREYLNEINKKEKSVLVFGNESEGISHEINSQSFHSVKIKGYSSCESLNAAVSSAIALYHFRT